LRLRAWADGQFKFRRDFKTIIHRKLKVCEKWRGFQNVFLVVQGIKILIRMLGVDNIFLIEGTLIIKINDNLSHWRCREKRILSKLIERID
jgi:hypothetical protein